MDCKNCGTKLPRAKRWHTHTFTVGARTVTIPVAGWICDGAGCEDPLNMDKDESYKAALKAAAILNESGDVTPASLTFQRNALQLSCDRLASLCQTHRGLARASPEMVTGWEAGLLRPPDGLRELFGKLIRSALGIAP